MQIDTATAFHSREARQAQHQRAKNRRAEAGLIRIGVWAPEQVAERIGALMAGMAAQLQADTVLGISLPFRHR